MKRSSILINEATKATTAEQFDRLRETAERELKGVDLADFLEVWYGERREAGV